MSEFNILSRSGKNTELEMQMNEHGNGCMAVA